MNRNVRAAELIGTPTPKVDMIGPVVDAVFLPRYIRLQPGLIRLRAAGGGETVYPVRQFAGDGDEKVLSPEMQKAVLLLEAARTLIGSSQLSNAAYLLGAHPEALQGATYAEILTGKNVDPAEKYRALGLVMDGVSDRLSAAGVDPAPVWDSVFGTE